MLPVSAKPFMSQSDGFVNIPVSYFRHHCNIDASQDDMQIAKDIVKKLPYSKAWLGVRTSTNEEQWVIRWKLAPECSLQFVKDSVVSFVFFPFKSMLILYAMY